MANLSDAHGEITVEKIGKEFIEFLKKAQDGAYYVLTEDGVDDLTPDQDGNLAFSFYASGRWSYSNNINGYLNGEWMHDTDKNNYDAYYNKLIKALFKKKGKITVEYVDSDVAMDWMGTGSAELSADENGEKCFSEVFNSEDLTIAGYADLEDITEREALEYLYGDEVSDVYDKYLKQWKEDHKGPKYSGMEPASPDEWYSNEYEEED